MFLKRMEVKGFKSFAFPTKIDFTDGLTVVVGPNGSGKSNINDAFKWVLGEASKKNLRASTSSDMIFAGSDTEKPAEFAEVKLIFNNENRILNIDFNEVEIVRKSFRQDKQNEYYINNELVRRRDIKNLFLGTGLGNTDLSIISQGSVTKVAESKPNELRELLNEAAGISRYQSQKNDAIRKLEKVEQSLDVFLVKLKELEKQIGPLKKKRDIAEKYLAIKEELAQIELPIMKNDLSRNAKLRDEHFSKKENSLAEKIILEENLFKIKKKLKSLQEKIISLDHDLYVLLSKQTELQQQSIITETGKEGLEEAIKESMKSLKEVKFIENDAKEKQDKLNKELKNVQRDKLELVTQKDKIYQNINKAEYELQKSSKSRTGALPRGTQSIIDNKGVFNEVYGTINDLIKFDKKYEAAIINSIGGKLNNIIVSDEKTVKEAINFLKTNNYGTATFVPAKKVEPREILKKYENIILKLEGYKGTLSSLIRTDSKFKNVVKSIAGRILVFSNIDLALDAAKLLGYAYEMVTLDGDQIFRGFTVKGGSNIKGNKVVELGKILDTLKKQHIVVKDKLYDIDEKIQQIRDSLSFSQTELARSEDRTTYIETNLKKLMDQYEKTIGKPYDLKSFEKSKEYISSSLSLETINSKIKSLQLEKQNIQRDVISKQDEETELSEKWKKAIETNTESTLALDKIVNEISRDLEILNKDYKMTLENLMKKDIPELTLPIDKAAIKREKFRNEISKLGYIDFDSITQYEEVFESYEELRLNVKELKDSKEKLLSTIELMDNQMIKQFSTIFERVNEKFQTVFSTLFRGGTAKISYTNPENILETGVVIDAKMPGKTIKSISLYSGGEKSLISLSLIFAINEVRNLPILMLDEVEAALDEANVDRFARFAKKLNETTQIIITSHRPGTMEQADILYGVTMQVKGITNIVSVRLSDAIAFAE